MEKSPDEEAVSKSPTRKPATGSSRALDTALVSAVLPLRDSRTFVFESYTHEACEEVRRRLPEEYRQLSDERLMERAIRLRKSGKLRPANEQEAARRLSEAKKIVRAYWDGDATREELITALDKLNPAASAPDGPGSQADQLVQADEEGPDTEEEPGKDERTMKALSVRSPWAEMIASGEKLIENRSRATKHRGLLAIHRSGKDGAIIAVVEVVGCFDVEEIVANAEKDDDYEFPWEEDQDRHAQGPYCWQLAYPIPVGPYPCKGALGLWNVPAEYVDKIMREVEEKG